MARVKVCVHTRGGVLGLDRVVRVEDGAATVSESGEARDVALDRDQADRLHRLAGRLAQALEVPVGHPPELLDGGWSDIDIVDADARVSLRVPTGADAPDEVWELLQEVEAIAEE
jgi:hypothetical protein